MRRLLGIACGASLLLACYGGVLLRGEQFAYRDAGHYYYPLYHQVEREWSAGRWPLWDPWQNGGQPLLGNPTAAVLYPGKLIYRALPYAWGARLYVVAHTALAALGAFALGRTLGASRAGSMIGGLSYAFAGPILFQSSNVIYLVGAAWAPWGLRAVDRLVRLRRRSGLAELAVVLAMEALGGDPQAAYLTALCGLAYVPILAWPGRRLAVAALVAVALAIAAGVATLLGGAGGVRAVALAGWAALAARAIWLHWRRRDGSGSAAIAAACGLALALGAAQLLPVAELSARSFRNAAAWRARTTAADRFSVEPYRLAEAVWPNVFGKGGAEARSWLQALPPAGGREPWTPSLYLGGLVPLLVMAAFGGGSHEDRHRRAWLGLIALAALLVAFGRFAGPPWWARAMLGDSSPLGPHDPLTGADRPDGRLADGTASPFHLLALTLPGFGLFRYPAKLLTFATLAASALTALGWDRVASGGARHLFRRAAAWASGISAATLVLSLLFRRPLLAWLSPRTSPDSLFGPADVPGGLTETHLALLHGVIVYALAWGLARGESRRAGALALVLVSADLALGNAWLVWTAPQACFEGPSEVARLIAEAERADPSPGPFRIHRMPVWEPAEFRRTRSPGRLGEVVAWERDTLKAHHATALGLGYALAPGVIELADYLRFFRGQTLPLPPAAAASLGLEPGAAVAYHPRRSFDLWGAQYFILPADPGGWAGLERGFASFLQDAERIAPPPAVIDDRAAMARWVEGRDWQLFRNRGAYPRAWLVHYAHVIPPLDPSDEEGIVDLMRRVVFQDDAIWHVEGRQVYDLRATAWVETDDRRALAGYLARRPVGPGESVRVVDDAPQRVELEATLASPGLVILADTFYPGWTLTIDGAPGEIYRVDRLLRGAAVKAGRHRLVYEYKPLSFRLGALISVAGLAALALLIAHARVSPEIAAPACRLNPRGERLRRDGLMSPDW